MSILIGGGTGFIGRNLVKHLAKSNYEVIVVTRYPKKKNEIDWSKIETSGIPKGVKAVVNVSGKPLINYPFEYRIIKTYEKDIYESRVGTNQILSKAIREMDNPPELFLSMSGVGYYPPSSTAVYNENGPNGTDRISRLSRDWELATILPPSVPTRRAIIRSGVVLGADGGIMKTHSRHLPPIVFGYGKQFFPWIHVKDMVRLIQFVIENPNMKGAFNGVTPNPVKALDFPKSWRAMLRKKEFASIGAFGHIHFGARLTTYLFGEYASVLLLEGQNVSPQRTLKSGFTFDFQALDKALIDIHDEKYGDTENK